MILLQPPGTCSTFTRSGSIYPPLGLCQIAATVAPDHAVVLDADGEGWTDKETMARVLAYEPLAVGLTATSYTLEMVERWAQRFATVGIRVLAGGPHASLAPVDLLQRCPSVEAAVVGEGELIFPELVGRLAIRSSISDLPGLVTRDTLRSPATIPRALDFAAVPFPRFDGLPIASYACPDARKRPMVTMMTARGCPHRCAFCSSPTLLGRKVRGPEVGAVLQELERLRGVHGVAEISFVDDVFTIKRERTLDLCNGMAARGLGLSWFCNARADQVTDELAVAMAAAGCHQVYLGFESGSQGILDGIRKGTTVEQLEAGAETLRRHGINRSVGFVIGLPGENDATVDASVAFAQRVQPERIQFTRFTPLVGSPLALETKTQSFHGRGDDKVQRWIDQCYSAMPATGWGQESW